MRVIDMQNNAVALLKSMIKREIILIITLKTELENSQLTLH
jgi:hypothetical protein